MSDILARILRSTTAAVDERKTGLPLDILRQEAAGRAQDRKAVFYNALAFPGISLIAEIKRASPSRGDIRPDLDVEHIARIYEEAGASAVSVLTEELHFRGSLDDLRAARGATQLPLLRKDFVIDPYQIWEAAAAGADAVLLIVAALDDRNLRSLSEEAQIAGLDVLTEVHDRDEAERAVASGATIVGINNRNLKSFEVDIRTTLDVLKYLPEEVLKVSESGIRSNQDVLRLKQAGVDAVLVGETLMRSMDPGSAIRDLLSGT